jgi:hypothetical protein
MHALFIRYHARQEQYFFADGDEAAKQMAVIESKIGKKWYGKNGDDETPTYRFSSATGEAAVCLEKIESVSITDLEKDDEFADQIENMKLSAHIRAKIKLKNAYNNAGLEEK